MKIYSWLLLPILLLWMHSTLAATNYFLQFEGFDGEATDTPHQDEIDVLHWSWGAHHAEKTFERRSPQFSKKVNKLDFMLSREVDKSSPNLFLACANGSHFAKVTLIGIDETGTETVKVEMKKVIISSYSNSGASGEDQQIENLTLNYGEIKAEYQENASRGNVELEFKVEEGE